MNEENCVATSSTEATDSVLEHFSRSNRNPRLLFVEDNRARRWPAGKPIARFSPSATVARLSANANANDCKVDERLVDTLRCRNCR